MMLMLAPVRVDDSEEIARKKFSIVSRFLDILLAWRTWNGRSIAYSTVQYSMFSIMRSIRGLACSNLAGYLYEFLDKENETFEGEQRVRLNQQNRVLFQLLLARITDYVEIGSGNLPRYDEYVTAKGKAKYEIEHIWANHPERHFDEFDKREDFDEYRNQIGGLLLLPKTFNASYGDLSYQKKIEHYNSQNLLARSLHEKAYDHNPGFIKFIEGSNLPFKPYARFDKKAIEERSYLYRCIAKQIWNPQSLLKEM